MLGKFYLSAILIVLLITSCSQNGNQRTESQRVKETEIYATVQMDLTTLSQYYSTRIENALKEKGQLLPDEVRKSLILTKAYLDGENFNTYEALKAVKLLENYQNKYKFQLLSDEELNQLTVLIRRKGQYTQPVVG